MILPDSEFLEKWTGLPAQCYSPRGLVSSLVVSVCTCYLSLFLLGQLQSLLHWITYRTQSLRGYKPDPRRQYIGCPPPGPVYTYNQRCKWDQFGCDIYGWPSAGGVVIRECVDLVELKFLGFDPVNPPTTRDEDPEKEDAFCVELRKIGGKWWQSQEHKYCVEFTGSARNKRAREELSKEAETELFIGWPESGGVLVAEFDKDEGLPDDMGKLRMATTMEGRCELLRAHFGAKFYRKPALYARFAFLGPPCSETNANNASLS